MATGIKPRLYAPAVSEYWVLDLERMQMIAHRSPGPEGYRDITAHGRGSELTPQHAELAPLSLSKLFDAI